jgi:hypothetical protein
LLKNIENHIYYIQGPLKDLIKLFNLISTTKVNTDSVTGEHKAALIAKKLPTTVETRECKLSKSKDKIISKDKV